MAEKHSARSRIVILVGLALALVVPLLPGRQYLEHIPGLDPLLGREAFWWALVVILLLYIRLIERRGLGSIGLRRPNWKTFAFGLLAAVVVLAGVGMLIGLALPLLHLQRNAAALQTILNTPYWYRVILVLRAAVAEEVLFRGYGIERLQEMTGSRFIAGTVTLAVFTIGHLSYWGWAQVLIAASAGLVLTVLYLWRRDLASNIIAHWLTDAVGLLLPHG